MTVQEGHLHVHQDQVEGAVFGLSCKCRINGLATVLDNRQGRTGALKNEPDQPLTVDTVFG